MSTSAMNPKPLRRDHHERSLVLVLDLAAYTDPERGVAALCADAKDLHIEKAASIEQGLRLLAKRHPDIVVLLAADATVEAVADMCARIRSAPGGTALPVLVTTTAVDVASIERLYASGVTDLATLPVADALLAHRIRNLVRGGRAIGGFTDVAASLARAQRLARVIQWWFDPEARTFRWSDKTDLVFAGLKGEGTLEHALLRWVQPHDRARVEAAFARLGPHEIDYQLVLADGEERLLYQQAELEIDPATGRICLVGTAQDITDVREAEDQVARLAHYDELTSLPNRAHACRFLKAAIAGAKLHGQQIAVVALDLDRFRRINESFGHSVGNAVLKEVAVRLRDVFEQEAARLGRAEVLVARLGGDEFVVVLRGVAIDYDPSALFRLLSARLSAPYTLGVAAEVVVSCSVGVASYPSNGSEVDTLLMHADSAKRVAKEKGRASFQVFAADVQRKLDRKIDVENRLRAALAAGVSLELHYQPKIEVPSGRVAGVEALLRWTPDSGGPISPLELVAVAEESGLIHPLGDWVLRTACLQAKAWSEQGAGLGMRVAVNISARQFVAPDFVDNLAALLARTALSPDLLELEITEGVMMADADAASCVLDRLKQLGLRVTLDDFGTGYSSLAYLTRFPIDCLKIDRSFVIGIGVTQKSEAIISAIIALSHSLGIEVVAEGVETEEQLSFLERQGPLEIQGWFFSKALPPEHASAWIERHAAARTSRSSKRSASPQILQSSRQSLGSAG